MGFQDPAGNLLRAVYQQLPVVHPGENGNPCIRADREQVPDLRLSNKGFFGTIPELDIGACDGFQLVGIYVFVTVQYGLSATEWEDFPAFIQKDIEIV